jgi:hypothetical protein
MLAWRLVKVRGVRMGRWEVRQAPGWLEPLGSC